MNARFRAWFRESDAACAFAEQLWTATQEWDDLNDEGRCDNMNAVLAWLAFGKEYQPFFAAHAHILRPALLQMYLSWRAANALERGDRDDVNKAYVLRAQVYGVFHLIAWLCGGDDWAAECGPEIWRTYGETADELWQEMQTCPTP